MLGLGVVLALLAPPTWPVPPFQAWVQPARVYLRAAAKASRQVGWVRRGDEVQVLRCVPDCGTPGAWAELVGPGALPLRDLAPWPPPADATDTAASEIGRAHV